MRVFTLKPLREFWTKHPHTEASLRTWYKVCKKAAWASLSDLKTTFPSADLIAGEHVVFDVQHNKVRVSANVVFRWGAMFIRRVMTHEEYEEEKKAWRGKLRRKRRN